MKSHQSFAIIHLLRSTALASLSTFLIASCGPQSIGKYSNPLIIGGQEAKRGEYTEVVAVLRDHRFICTGTVIDPKFVLTAAHCVEKLLRTAGFQENTIEVFVGEDANASSGFVVPARHISLHPELWQGHLGSNDLALIETSRDIPAVPAELLLPGLRKDPSPKVTPTDFIIVGFGMTSNTPGQGTQGKKNWASAKARGFSGTDFFVGSKKADTCLGDSGGPAFYVDSAQHRHLVAVTSRGPMPCAQDEEPGIMTMVNAGACWLSDAISSSHEPLFLACQNFKKGTSLPLDENTVTQLHTLTVNSQNIRDISILRNALHLQTLDLAFNQIEDARVLLTLNALKFVDLRNNRIKDSGFFDQLKRRGVTVIGEHTQEDNLNESEYLRISALGAAAGVENRATILALRPILANGDDARKSRDLKLRHVLGLADKGVRSLAPLANLENLTTLILAKNILYHDLNPLLTLPHLRNLDLRDCKLDMNHDQQNIIRSLQNKGVRVLLDGIHP